MNKFNDFVQNGLAPMGLAEEHIEQLVRDQISSQRNQTAFGRWRFNSQRASSMKIFSVATINSICDCYSISVRRFR